MNKHNKPANYNLRRTFVGAAAVGAVVLTGEGISAVTSSVGDRIHREHTTVDIPPAGGMYKTFHLTEQFKVGKKTVTIRNLSDASIAADLPDVDNRATLDMLKSQLPKGMDPTEVPADLTFKLPSDSRIGDLHTGE